MAEGARDEGGIGEGRAAGAGTASTGAVADAGAPTDLVYAVWELTLRCDLSCGHCGSRAGKPRARELSTDEALDLVGQIADLGAREVTLIGGEAYLRDDWHVVARAVRDRGMRCTITTGGRAFTPVRARLARDAGVDGISVSLDGLAAAHDRQRGVRGSFDAALGALDAARDVGLALAVNTQLNRISTPDLGALYDLLAARRVRAWQTQITVAMGRAVDHADWLLQPYELLDLMPRLAAFAARGAAGDGPHVWAGNNVGYFGPYEHVLRRDRDDAHATGCGAGLNTLGIESDGTIKGCPSLPTRAFAGGNVRDRPLREIWDHAKELRFAREPDRERHGIPLWGFCATCYYAPVCRGGCTWTAHVLFGRAGNNPYCHHRAIELARQGLRERVVPVEAAPGEPFDHGRFDLVTEPLDAEADVAEDARRRRSRRGLPIVVDEG